MLNINQEFIDAFIESVRKTLEIQCTIEASPLKWYIKDSHVEQKIALTGIVGITSGKFTGNVNLSLTESGFLGIMNKMLDENYTQISPELTNGSAELLNIIYGNAKTLLNARGYEFNAAIPTVISGHSMQLTSVTKSPVLVIPFQTEYGKFYLEIVEHIELDDSSK